MSASASPFVTSLLLPAYQSSLVAEVIGADPTATTYVLNCVPDLEDYSQCGTFNNTAVLGPWASKTLPAGAASTGEFEFYVSVPYEEDPWLFSLRCDMTRSVAKKCTTTNIGGNDDGYPTATITDSDSLDMYGFATLEYAKVIITAGQELLAATHTGVAKATATATETETKTSAAASADETSADEASSTGDSTSAATPEATGGAVSKAANMVLGVAAAGLVTMMIL